MAHMAAKTTTHQASAPTGALPGSASRPLIILLLGLVILGIAAYASLMFGAVRLSPGEVWAGLTQADEAFARQIVWQIRYPRLLDAAIVGAGLAVGGALLQGVTRNPLADPTILGVTAACGLASASLIVYNPQSPQWAIAAACAVGGIAGAGILYIIAWRNEVSPLRLTLAGVALSAFFGAAIVGLLASSRTFLQTSLGFLAGGLYGSEWRDLWAALPWFTAGLAAAAALSGRLNILALGDDVAAGLGLLTNRTRLLILVTVGILTAAAVSIAGLVSFVGLVCPHIARYTIGQDNRLVIPFSALYGAILVVLADLGARLVIQPAEVPMGIITAAIGAPFLLYLVRFR